MAKVSFFIVMLDLSFEGMVLHLFQCLLSEFSKHHLDIVRACIKTIMSLIDEDDDVCKQ